MYQFVNRIANTEDHERVMSIPCDQEEPIVPINPPIRRSEQVRRFTILRDYVVYLGEDDYDIGHTLIQ